MASWETHQLSLLCKPLRRGGNALSLIQTRSLGVQMLSSQASQGPNEVLVVLGGSRTATLLDGLSSRPRAHSSLSAPAGPWPRTCRFHDHASSSNTPAWVGPGCQSDPGYPRLQPLYFQATSFGPAHSVHLGRTLPHLQAPSPLCFQIPPCSCQTQAR